MGRRRGYMETNVESFGEIILKMVCYSGNEWVCKQLLRMLECFALNKCKTIAIYFIIPHLDLPL